MAKPLPNSVRRLWIRLTLVWTAAWLIGLLAFAIVAQFLASQYYDEQIDSRLRIQAIAVYGLAFFNETGEFESDLLDYDDALFEDSTGVWIVEPSAPPQFHLIDDQRFAEGKLLEISQFIVNSDQEYFESGIDEFGRPFRLLAIPTYNANEVAPRAAIIVANDPSSLTLAKQRLLAWTILSLGLLGVGGIFIGGILAHWSLRPLANFISQREQFLSAAAHELRTPLASISAVVESGNAGNEPAAKSLNRLTELVSRATQCTEDLLLYARLDAGVELLEKEPLRLDLLVESEAPQDSSIQFVLRETIIHGDASLLKAMMRNLFANSMRHATDPSNILVTLRDQVLSFENDGDLFPEEIVSQNHAKFKLLPSTTGSGLGLAIVQMIVRRHGGELKISNSSDNKAKVDCVFPA